MTWTVIIFLCVGLNASSFTTGSDILTGNYEVIKQSHAECFESCVGFADYTNADNDDSSILRTHVYTCSYDPKKERQQFRKQRNYVYSTHIFLETIKSSCEQTETPKQLEYTMISGTTKDAHNFQNSSLVILQPSSKTVERIPSFDLIQLDHNFLVIHRKEYSWNPATELLQKFCIPPTFENAIGFVGSAVYYYKNHSNLVIIRDSIWTDIFMSIDANNNSESLRSQLLATEMLKSISVNLKSTSSCIMSDLTTWCSSVATGFMVIYVCRSNLWMVLPMMFSRMVGMAKAWGDIKIGPDTWFPNLDDIDFTDKIFVIFVLALILLILSGAIVACCMIRKLCCSCS